MERAWRLRTCVTFTPRAVYLNRFGERLVCTYIYCVKHSILSVGFLRVVRGMWGVYMYRVFLWVVCGRVDCVCVYV